MTHFRELELIRYHNGPCDADEWHCPLLAVGWLEREESFTTGACPPSVLEKLRDLRGQFNLAFSEFSFRGLHECSFCETGVRALSDSHINFFIPGKDVIYLAPGRVDHYIQAHAYLPPQEFIEAVFGCPDPVSSEYTFALKELNHGRRPPLFPERWNIIQVDADGNRFIRFAVDDEGKALEFARMYSLRNPGHGFEIEKAPDRFSC